MYICINTHTHTFTQTHTHSYTHTQNHRPTSQPPTNLHTQHNEAHHVYAVEEAKKGRGE